VATTVGEGAMEGVSSVTGQITVAEVVVEEARRVVLMLGTRGLTTVLDMLVIVGGAHQQPLVHLQSEGQSRCASLGVLSRGPQIISKSALSFINWLSAGLSKNQLQISSILVLDRYFCRQQKR
jgi:hypothetical protein